MTTRAEDFEQRALIARATMNALTIVTSVGVPARLRTRPPAERRRGCVACGDATGVRCCEFGRDF